jgi:hypothetical protein
MRRRRHLMRRRRQLLIGRSVGPNTDWGRSISQFATTLAITLGSAFNHNICAL